MPSPPAPEKLLLVEGEDDKHVILHLCQRAGLAVGFDIAVKGDVDAVLRSIRNEARSPGRESLGIVVDANNQLAGRWQSISSRFDSVGIRLPSQPSSQGTVVPSAGSGIPRVGAWLMPDNTHRGELEDFLRKLVPRQDGVWPLARSYVQQARQAMSSQRPPKRAKAEIHAWLAAVTGGMPMGRSVGTGAFNVNYSAAKKLLRWLEDVFA